MIDTQELLVRNRKYAQHHVPAPTPEEVLKAGGGKRAPLPVVVTCFDARVIPEEFFNLKVGEVMAYRNMGGRIDDKVILQIASLGVIRTLGDILIVHHTECGVAVFKNEDMKRKTREKFGPDARIDDFDFGAIADLHESVRHDVNLMQETPFVSKDTVVRGFIYDIKSGLVQEVE